ncbi:MAG: CotH kinase family protein, partial [Ferruginibacter sp.]
YIFSIDKEADGWFSSYPSNTTNGTAYCQFSYITPKITAIVPQQKDYIKQYVDSFENALMQNNFQDKQNGWRKFAQDSSFVDYFIVNEISRNVDGYRLSSFFHKDKYSVGGKIKAGPVWDFDLAFRNANYCSGSDTSGWAWQFNDVCAGDYWQVPFWWQRFNNDTAFTRTVLCRWKALRTSSLSDARIETLIDSVVNLTTTARTRHFQKWNTLGYYVWPNPQPIATSYTEEIQLLKTWIHNRIQWIDGHLKQEGECAYFPPNVTASLVVNIAPNPIVGDAKLYIQSSKDQMIAIQLYNMEGQLLQSFQKDVVRGMNSITQPMKTLAKGVYMIRIQSAAGEKFNKKFLKD